MAAYLVAQITIHDRERYALYEAGFMDVFQQYNGKLLSVDENPDTLEGEWACTRTVLIEFPTKTDAQAWYHSNDYQNLAKHRFAASVGNAVMLNGLDEQI